MSHICLECWCVCLKCRALRQSRVVTVCVFSAEGGLRGAHPPPPTPPSEGFNTRSVFYHGLQPYPNTGTLTLSTCTWYSCIRIRERKRRLQAHYIKSVLTLYKRTLRLCATIYKCNNTVLKTKQKDVWLKRNTNIHSVLLNY